MSKRGLGRGLEALIPPIADFTSSTEEVSYISLENIIPNAFQPRRNFDSEKLEELAESIKEHGVIQPIVVRSCGDGKYEIIAGERRWRACKILGLENIPAIIKDLTDVQVTEVALIENIQREDLNPIEEAKAYQTLIKEFDLKQKELSRKIGKSRSFIANMLRLLNLSEEVQEYLISEKITIGHARALLALENKDEQLEVADKIIELGLTVRDTEKLVKSLLEDPLEEKEEKKKEQPKEELDYIEIEFREKLQDVLGTKVNLKKKQDGQGKIEIEFYTKEDLERIIEILFNLKEEGR